MKIIKLSFVLFFVSVILLFACTVDENSQNLAKPEIKSNSMLKKTNVDALNISLKENFYRLDYTSNIKNGEIVSHLEAFYDDKSIFTISYDFDIKVDHWKLKQAPNVIIKSNELKNNNISINVLTEIDDIITEALVYIQSETIGIKNVHLISSLNYHKSIIRSVIRSGTSEVECDCRVHPEFLIDKTYFNCQEEQFYDTNFLRNTLNDYLAENGEVDASTTNLMLFLNNYENDQIRFDEYYNFYFQKESFDLFVSEVSANSSNDCAWWCPLGCGSSHGCCGNYSGCCLYWAAGCYIHDKLCPDCKPAGFCLPGCKPDKPKRASLQMSIY